MLCYRKCFLFLQAERPLAMVLGLRKKELKKKIDEAQRYIDKNYLGENESADKITKNLNFVKSIPNSAIEIIWNGDSEEYIDDNGKLNRDGLKSEKQLEIGATLKYKDYKKELFYQLTVIPPQKSHRARW